MNELISIIVPVYNTEQYIEACIKSILTQTYQNLELILVDDGSGDRSGEICGSWAQKDPRVKYFYQNNAGVGAARNRGMGLASGEYISFVDSDDYIEPDFCEKFAELFSPDRPVIFCEYRTLRTDGKEFFKNKYSYQTETIPASAYEYWDKRLKCSACCAMFRRENLAGISFSESLAIGEDALFVAKAIARAKNLTYMDIPLYNYRILDDSAYHSCFDQKRMSEIDAWQQICEAFPKGGLCRLSADARCGIVCMDTMKTYAKDPNFDRDSIEKVIRVYRRKLPHLIRYDLLKHCLFLRHLLVGIMPHVYLRRHRNVKTAVGIITMYCKTFNCGNRLQHYAVQTVLKRMGFSVVSYTFYDDAIDLEQRLRFWVHERTGFRFTRNRDYWQKIIARIMPFRRFNCRYIQTEKIEDLEDVKDKKFYVIGSDQVWNPLWFDDTLKRLYLLDCVEPKKRVCFAPSFGIEQLPEEWKPWFKETLEHYPMLSVREEAGARIIKELTGRDAQVLVDPTMMLTPKDWRRISKRPTDAPKRYVLTYFLSSPNEQAAQTIAKLQAEQRVYEIMNLRDREGAVVGPSEFLWLFDHAELILTDSFHACIFSFLFDKPFVVFDRNLDECNMNSRLETMLKKFHLERKYAGSGLENSIWEHDYRDGYGVLEQEREKTMKFLTAAFRED